MTVDLFAGISVRNLSDALTWYERLLGHAPTFRPNDTEAVWTLGDHRHVYVEYRPDHAGHAMVVVFVEDLDVRTTAIASRGLLPDHAEEYENGVRKVVYRDPDGNEFGFAGGAG